MRIRTGYSFKKAVGHLPDVASRLIEIGWDVGPISDTMSTFGFTRWATACAKAGLRPVFGVELPVVALGGEKKPTTDYWTFFAKDHLRSVHDLVGTATGANDASKLPTLLYSEVLAAKDVIKISGERTNLELIEPQDDLYIALSPSLPKALFNEAKKRGHKFIATSDNVYPRETDREFYRVGLGRRSDTQTYPQHIVSDQEWAQSLDWFVPEADLLAALENRSAAFSVARATLPKAELLRPEKPKTLRQMCIEGAARVGCDLADPIYAERLERELRLIAEKEFEDYFYIIADMIAWAKERMVVGPARGSSCGSLVCYLLNITTIDPIPFGLIFERFIDINRKDLPDIDIDFSDKRRDLVFEYVEKKYGRDHVARLGTVGLFKPRSALKQAAASLRIPSWKVDRVLEGLINRSSGDSRALQALEDTLNDTEAGEKIVKEHPEILIAGRMEGHPNAASQHAAGIVITEQPIKEYVAVDRRTKSAMCDKKDAEVLNLLKIDALGLTQLSIFERTLELIGRPSKSGWLETLPLDDQAAFDVLNNGKWSGIFQFAGGALQSLTKQVHVTEINDIISITALARPGPLATGGSNSWVRRRGGLEEVAYPHPALKPYLEATLGIVVYQEQVMEIGRQIGDLSWEQVTNLRKAMSRSLGKEYFDQFGDPFKEGGRKKGIPEDILYRLWEDLCAYGSWAFNKAHAVAYGLVSYWCCYLKAHHPVEFAAATLDAEADPAKQIQTLRELHLEGIEYISVDPELSTDRWVPAEKDGKKLLIGPLTSIHGVGPATVAEILTARRRGEELRPGLVKKLSSAKTAIDSLTPIRDAIKRIHPDITQKPAQIVSRITPIIDVQCGVRGEVTIIGVLRRIAPRDDNDLAHVAKRGYAVKGWSMALNLFVLDDTDEIFCKISRFNYKNLAPEIIERGKPGKVIYAIKGTVPKDFRMISVTGLRYLGDLDWEKWIDESTLNKSDAA
jgi:DNA polymerase III alpha subunit